MPRSKKKVSDKTIARRIREKNNQEVVAAWEAQKTYSKLMHRRSSKDVDSFIKTPTYPHFIKLIRFAKEVNLPDLSLYLKIMITSKRPATTWCHDKSYRIFLQQMNSSVSAIKSIEISARELQNLADKLDLPVRKMIELMQVTEILQLVRQRRLSPWLIFHSKTLKQKFAELDAGMQKTASGVMDPTYWTIVMQQNGKAVILAKKVNELLGI